MRKILFAILSLSGLVIQAFGLYIILWLVGLATTQWLIVLTIAILYTIADLYRHFYFKKKGLRPHLGVYKQENDGK